MTATDAVIYARFSTMEQGKGYSLERQISNGTAYVEKMGWNLFGVLTDEGRSAFHGANRLSGSSLFAFEAEAREGLHRGKTLCVENIDRLSRQGAKIAAQLVWSLNANGVDVSTWHDGMTYRAGDNGNMGELMMLIMKAELAWEESSKKSKRTGDSWKKRYKDIAAGDRSVLVGRCPAWIEERDGRYELKAREVGVLNEIFDLYISGIGIYRIVQILNERKEPVWTTGKQNKGGGWYLAYVHKLLTSRAVLGELVTLKGELISTDYWPQAVTSTKFNKAAEQRATRVKTGGGDRTRVNNLLSGLVRCSCCNGPAGYENKGENGVVKYVGKSGIERSYQRKHYERLRCDANRRRKGCTNSTLFDYKVIESAVLDRALALAVDSGVDERDDVLTEQYAEAERRLAGTKSKLDNLVEALADGGSKTIVGRIEVLEREAEEGERALAALRTSLGIKSIQPSNTDDLALVQSLRADLSSEDKDVRFYARTKVNTSLKRIMDSILLGDDGTFAVIADAAVWHFNGTGEVIGGQPI